MEKLQAKLRDAERDAADAADETEAKSVCQIMLLALFRGYLVKGIAAKTMVGISRLGAAGAPSSMPW